MSPEASPTARLDIVPTPLGNLGDVDPDLVSALQAADVLVCEDSRVARRLLSALGVRLGGRPLLVMRADNEAARTAQLQEHWAAGRRVALMSDAGTPLVSDPGARTVRAAIDGGVALSVVPGPSAVTSALALSGISAARWCVEGFLPRSGRDRAARLAALAHEPRTAVLFESPRRVADTLADLADACGGARPVAVLNDLTKRYERVWRGELAAVSAELRADSLRGEFTIVLGGVDG